MNTLELTKSLIRFETTSDNLDELKNCRNYISDLFKNSDLYVRKYKKNNAYSVVITNKDSYEFDVIMSGHFDVVPARRNNFKPKVKGTKLYGRGACDMKGAIAVMIQVMLKVATQKNSSSLCLMLTGDEEIGGFDGTKYLIEEKNYRAKCAIVPDEGYNFRLCTAEKGLLHLTITAHGLAAHGSSPWLGENAVKKLITVYQQMNKLYSKGTEKDRWHTTVCLGKLHGGDTTNKVPDYAEMCLDIRHTEKTSKQDILNNLKKICDQVQGTHYTIDVEGSSSFTSKDGKYLQLFKNSIETVTNKKICFMRGHGASDGRFFAQHKIPVLMTMADASEAHIKDEWVDINSLNHLERVFTHFIKTL